LRCTELAQGYGDGAVSSCPAKPRLPVSASWCGTGPPLCTCVWRPHLLLRCSSMISAQMLRVGQL